MGAADVVPGVSGGTIAFISGIYDELVDSLRNLTPSVFVVLRREGLAAFWRVVNGNFFIALMAGILTSVLSLARLVRLALEQHPLLIWSFFFGLILGSVVYVARQQRHWRPLQFVGLVAGVAAALAMAFSPPVVVAASTLNIFLAGMLAVCAMILPGISGSFILLLLGMYPVVIRALIEVNLLVLSTFALGAVIGLVTFSHLLSWLLHQHRATTLSVLIGFLAGSLGLVWPWKIEVALADNSLSEGLVGGRKLMSPMSYDAVIGNAQIVECLLLMAFGLILVLVLEGLAVKPGIDASRSQ